jgi:methionyl-tRNA formyltransferase
LDFSKPIADVYNTIRAANPAPGAWTTMRGVKLDIYDAALVSGTGEPGTILAIDANGITIAGKGGAILAKRIKAADGKKIAAAEYAQAAGLAVGDAFSAPVPKPAA